jgi:hypothetical protein
VGLRSFLLLMGTPLFKREVGVHPRRRLSRWNRRHSLSGRSIHRPRYGCGGGRVKPPVLCLLGEGRSIHPSPSEAVWNSSLESPIMAHRGDGGLLWDEPMTAASEPSLLGERLRSLKQSVMNSHDRRSPLAATVSTDDGTIRTSRGKAHCKSPYLAHQLSVFSTSARTEWSRSHIPVLRWSYELQSTK